MEKKNSEHTFALEKTQQFYISYIAFYSKVVEQNVSLWPECIISMFAKLFRRQPKHTVPFLCKK